MAPEYFSAPGQRFPLWPEWHPEGALALFTATATLLFLPKVLSVFLIWVKGACEFGGASRLADSIVMLLLFSGMLAPVRMLFHMRFVIGAFLGWMDHQLEIAAARGCRNQLGRSLPAVMEATPCWDWSGTAQYIGWRQDSCGGCCRLSVPLSVFSSRVTLGRSFRRARLFVISEEVDLPSELAATILYNDNGKVLSNFDDAVVDPLCNALLCAALTARPGSTGCDLVHPSNIGSECI